MDEIEVNFLTNELYLRIFTLEDMVNDREERIYDMLEFLVKTNITLGDMEKITNDFTFTDKKGNEFLRILNVKES